MTDDDVDDALLVRPSASAQLRTLLFLVLFFCAYPVLGATGVIGVPLVVLGMIVFGVILLIGSASALRARHAQWELRLDPSGVTVNGHQPVPWTDLTEVRVTGLRRRWFFWFSLGYRVVSFVGQPGVHLPALPSTSSKGSFELRSARMRERRYGSGLIVLPSAMDMSNATGYAVRDLDSAARPAPAVRSADAASGGRAMTVTFLLTALVIVATPGTGALYTIAAGLSRGVRASVVAAAGCTLGIVPHLAAAITGTAALLRASGLAFQTIKVLGVAYLLYTAWSTWRDTSTLSVGGAEAPARARVVIRSAVLINLLNPKLTIFFFAFLPQFVPSGSPHALARLLGLSAVFMLMTFVVFAGYGAFAASVRRHVVDRPRVVDRVRRVFAVSFVALGVKLATTART